MDPSTWTVQCKDRIQPKIKTNEEPSTQQYPLSNFLPCQCTGNFDVRCIRGAAVDMGNRVGVLFDNRFLWFMMLNPVGNTGTEWIKHGKCTVNRKVGSAEKMPARERANPCDFRWGSVSQSLTSGQAPKCEGTEIDHGQRKSVPDGVSSEHTCSQQACWLMTSPRNWLFLSHTLTCNLISNTSIITLHLPSYWKYPMCAYVHVHVCGEPEYGSAHDCMPEFDIWRHEFDIQGLLWSLSIWYIESGSHTWTQSLPIQIVLLVRLSWASLTSDPMSKTLWLQTGCCAHLVLYGHWGSCWHLYPYAVAPSP